MGLLNDLTGRANSAVKLGLRVSDDTGVHQLNRAYCVMAMVILTLFVCSKQYVGEPMSCYCPANLKDWQVDYTNTNCWVHNTYTARPDGSLPEGEGERKTLRITYYQYVPILFGLMAFGFYLPRMLWKNLVPISGLNIKRVLNLADSASSLEHAERDAKLRYVAEHLYYWIEIREKVLSTKNSSHVLHYMAKCGLSRGRFLTLCHIFVTFMYAANSIGQFFLVDLLMDNRFYNLGWDVMITIFSQKNWEDQMRFPRVAFCDFDIRQLNNLQRWTVQCALPINMFNEKAFVIVWFLLLLMSLVNVVYFFYNFITVFFPWRSEEYVLKYINIARAQRVVTKRYAAKQMTSSFIDEFLKQDGVFIIFLLSHHVSLVIGAHVVGNMWNLFVKKRSQASRTNTLRQSIIEEINEEEELLSRPAVITILE